MKLNELRSPTNSRKDRKRIGRGQGSGTGGTSGKGHKGQKSRAGYSRMRGFEGGQMPLHRRIPKFGFTNIFRKEFQVVNIEQLNRFSDGDMINKEILLKSGLIKKKLLEVKILGGGDISKKLTVEANAFTKSAIEKIEKAGGKTVVI